MLKDFKVDCDKQKTLWKKHWLGEKLVFVKLNDKGAPYNPSTIGSKTTYMKTIFHV